MTSENIAQIRIIKGHVKICCFIKFLSGLEILSKSYHNLADVSAQRHLWVVHKIVESRNCVFSDLFFKLKYPSLRSFTNELCDFGQVTSHPCTDSSGSVISKDFSNSRFCFPTALKSLDYRFVDSAEGRWVTKKRGVCFRWLHVFKIQGIQVKK